MLDIYSVVTATGFPNFTTAHIVLPSNLRFSSWDELVRIHDDAKVVGFLRLGFSVGYEGPIPTPASDIHSSTHNHSSDVTSYIATEVREGAMLGSFHHKPFTPWCQVNVLLTSPKRDSHVTRVIMDLSWPYPPAISVNGCTLKVTYIPCKMHLPSAHDLIQLIKEEGWGTLAYMC